jgi:hypothetical protein
MTEKLTMETTARQQKYVADQEAKGDGLGLVFADAFIRGMRDIGYKSNGWALAEMVDNAVQAGATVVNVAFGYEKSNKSRAKPDMLAVVDNGVGMIPKMISYAVRWGGTDREDDRKGFGRYGFGLPSSAVSITERYTVYSKVTGGKWHAVTVDIKALAKVASDLKATNELLQPRQEAPPSWVAEEGKHIDVSKIKSGTVVVLDRMDRLQWRTANTLQSKLMQLFGVIYRHWLPTPKIVVDKDAVKPVDPLFLMETGLYHDETEVRAQRVDTKAFEVETSDGKTGRVKIRASFLPPNFQNADPKKFGRGVKLNNRFKIMRDYNGLLVCREGRQIDCIAPRWTKFQNQDVNVKIEIDFDPLLDEFFGITTAKQQVVIDDVMWDKIEQVGRLRDLVRDIRAHFDEELGKLQAAVEQETRPNQPRPSEEAMTETEKFRARPESPSDDKKAEGKKNLEDAAAKIAETTGRKKSDVVKELEDIAQQRRFAVEFKPIPEGPFYRPHRLGEQKRLIINTQHPFYSKVYAVSPEVSSALEVLLLVLAEAELEAEGDAGTFYKAARTGWSERLRYALDRLRPNDEMRDKASAMAEEMQMQPVTAPKVSKGA